MTEGELSLEAFQKQLGYQFKDSRYLRTALTHSSHSSHHNERLEFLGDSLVNFYVAEALYRRFSNSREGDLTRLRALLVKGATLAELARELHIVEYLRMGQGERASGGAQRDSILADATEALIGAI